MGNGPEEVKKPEDLSAALQAWNERLPSDAYRQRLTKAQLSMEGVKLPATKQEMIDEARAMDFAKEIAKLPPEQEVPPRIKEGSQEPTHEESLEQYEKLLDTAWHILQEDFTRGWRSVRDDELLEGLQKKDLPVSITKELARKVLEDLQSEGLVGQEDKYGRFMMLPPSKKELPPAATAISGAAPAQPATVSIQSPQPQAKASQAPNTVPQPLKPNSRFLEEQYEMERDRELEQQYAERDVHEGLRGQDNFLEAEWEAHVARESAAIAANPEVMASAAEIADIRNRCAVAKVSFDQLQKSRLGPIQKLRAYFGKTPESFAPQNDRDRQIMQQYQDLQKEYDQKREVHQRLLYTMNTDELNKKRSFNNFVLQDDALFKRIQLENAPPPAKWLQAARKVASAVGFDTKWGRIAWGTVLGTAAAVPMATLLGAMGIGAGVAGTVAAGAVAMRVGLRTDTEFNGPLRRFRDIFSGFYARRRTSEVTERHIRRVGEVMANLKPDNLAEAAAAIRTSIAKVERSNRRTALRRMGIQAVAAAILGGGAAGGAHEAINIFWTAKPVEILYELTQGMQLPISPVPDFPPTLLTGTSPSVPPFSGTLSHGEIPPVLGSEFRASIPPTPGTLSHGYVPPVMGEGPGPSAVPPADYSQLKITDRTLQEYMRSSTGNESGAPTPPAGLGGNDTSIWRSSPPGKDYSIWTRDQPLNVPHPRPTETIPIEPPSGSVPPHPPMPGAPGVPPEGYYMPLTHGRGVPPEITPSQPDLVSGRPPAGVPIDLPSPKIAQPELHPIFQDAVPIKAGDDFDNILDQQLKRMNMVMVHEGKYAGLPYDKLRLGLQRNIIANIREGVKGFSPQVRAEMGFIGGSVDRIPAGGTLHLDALNHDPKLLETVSQHAGKLTDAQIKDIENYHAPTHHFAAAPGSSAAEVQKTWELNVEEAQRHQQGLVASELYRQRILNRAATSPRSGFRASAIINSSTPGSGQAPSGGPSAASANQGPATAQPAEDPHYP